MTTKLWKWWFFDRKDYLPKELGNLAKNMIHELKKWYRQLDGYEEDWRAQAYRFLPGDTPIILWSKI